VPPLRRIRNRQVGVQAHSSARWRIGSRSGCFHMIRALPSLRDSGLPRAYALGCHLPPLRGWSLMGGVGSGTGRQQVPPLRSLSLRFGRDDRVLGSMATWAAPCFTYFSKCGVPRDLRGRSEIPRGRVADLASLRSADSRGGCLYMGCGAGCRQQVPFGYAQGRLSHACGALRNDKVLRQRAALKLRSTSKAAGGGARSTFHILHTYFRYWSSHASQRLNTSLARTGSPGKWPGTG
jgi:hypothetical protein